MSADEHVRAAADRAILRERLRLRARFVPSIAAVLECYYAETVTRGLPSDETRARLSEILAPHGLADPDGQGRLPQSSPITLAGAAASGVAGPAVRLARQVEEEYRRADLRAYGVALDVFRAEVARRNRESPRPVAPREVSAAMLRQAVPRRAGAPLAWLHAAARAFRRLPFRRS